MWILVRRIISYFSLTLSLKITHNISVTIDFHWFRTDSIKSNFLNLFKGLYWTLFIFFSSYIPIRMWSNDSLHLFRQLVMINLQKKGNKWMHDQKHLKMFGLHNTIHKLLKLKKPQVKFCVSTIKKF